MKKHSIFALAALLSTSLCAHAQSVEDFGIFDHLSAGLSIGTTGIGLEVAAPITNYFQARMGYSFMPAFKYKHTADFKSSNDIFKKEDGTGYYDEIEAEGKLNMGDFKLLFDVYPFKGSAFHFTAGAYIGKSKIVKIKNLNHFINTKYWGNSGPELGTGQNTYTVVSDDEGRVNIDVKTNGFKPYLGIGVGRAVPKNRIGVCFDFGVQFWGKPEAWTNISDDNGKSYRKVEKSKITNDEDYCDDIKDVIKVAEKVVVFPVLTLRINGRIF